MMPEAEDLDSDFSRRKIILDAFRDGFAGGQCSRCQREKQFNHPQISQINADYKRLMK
jgi:hypothetical protein